jgi:hypothetical protein
MTDRAAYRKRLQHHLGETKNHARLVERRISKLGGGGHLLQNLSARGIAMAKSPMHALRRKSDEEKLLKNAKTEHPSATAADRAAAAAEGRRDGPLRGRARRARDRDRALSL